MNEHSAFRLHEHMYEQLGFLGTGSLDFLFVIVVDSFQISLFEFSFLEVAKSCF